VKKILGCRYQTSELVTYLLTYLLWTLSGSKMTIEPAVSSESN